MRLIFLLLISFPIALAAIDTLDPEYACSENTHITLDVSVCTEVKDAVSGMEMDAKKEQMLRLYTMGNSQISSKMDFAVLWNSLMDINFSAVPEDIHPYNENCREGMLCVEDAWISLASVMPSFIEEGQTYINHSGTVQVIYSYQVHHPPDGEDYSKEGGSCIPPPPTNRYGGCRTEFTHLDDTQLKVIADGKAEKIPPRELGHNILVSFSAASEQPLFEAELDVSNIVTRKGWEWEKKHICCESGEDGCIDYGYSYSCEKVPNTVKIYGTKLIDSKETAKYVSVLGQNGLYNIIILDPKTDPLIILQTDLESFDLQAGMSSTYYEAYDSRIVYKHAPYNVLEVTRTRAGSLFSNMNVLKKENNTFLFDLPAANFEEACSIRMIEPFSEKKEPCMVNYQKSAKLSVSTNKEVYTEGDQIFLEIAADSDHAESAQVTYAGKNYWLPLFGGKADLGLQAVKGQDEIRVTSGDQEKVKKISVNTQGKYTHLLIFGLSIFLVFLLFKAYSKFYLERY